MKKVFYFIISILIIVGCIDWVFGYFSRQYVESHTLPGDYKSIDYLLKEADEDIIILGSSIALNSTMPDIISDSTHLSCFNGGANGQSLPYFETMLECILKRYTPKYILLGMRAEELTGTGIGSRYNILSPYFESGFPLIRENMEAQSHIEKYLLKSNLYRYNTIWWRILLYHFVNPGDGSSANGFVAKGIPLTYPTLTTETKRQKITTERINCFTRIIQKCKDKEIRLIVYFPPNYKHYSEYPTPTIKTVNEICKQNDIPCFNDVADSMFLQNNKFFFDDIHLNKDGAFIYSQIIASRIRKDMNQ